MGFSGVVFGLIVVDNHASGASSRRWARRPALDYTLARASHAFDLAARPCCSIFGFFSVPAKLYPWALLVFWQLLLPQSSFLGHLAGVLVSFGSTRARQCEQLGAAGGAPPPPQTRARAKHHLASQFPVCSTPSQIGQLYVWGLLRRLTLSAATTQRAEHSFPFDLIYVLRGFIAHTGGSAGDVLPSSSASGRPSGMYPSFSAANLCRRAKGPCTPVCCVALRAPATMGSRVMMSFLIFHTACARTGDGCEDTGYPTLTPSLLSQAQATCWVSRAGAVARTSRTEFPHTPASASASPQSAAGGAPSASGADGTASQLEAKAAAAAAAEARMARHIGGVTSTCLKGVNQ